MYFVNNLYGCSEEGGAGTNGQMHLKMITDDPLIMEHSKLIP